MGPNATIVKNNIDSVGNALTQLLTNITNAIGPMTSAGSTDTLSRVQALKIALESVSQAVLDAQKSYDEAGNIG